MDEIINELLKFASDSSAGIWLKLAFGSATLIVGFYLKTYFTAAMRRAREAEEAKNRQEMTKENKKQNEEVKKDSDAVDDFLK